MKVPVRTRARRAASTVVMSMMVVAVWATPARAATAYKRISLSSSNAVGNGPSTEPAASADGRFVAFSSEASDLVAGDTNGVKDVFLRDRDVSADGEFDEAGDVSTQRISIGADGTEPNAASDTPVVSPNGRYVGFITSATNIGDPGLAWDIYVRDRDHGDGDGIYDEVGDGATFLASTVNGFNAVGNMNDNAFGGIQPSSTYDISDTGIVVFAWGPFTSPSHVYARDLAVSGASEVVSVRSDEASENGSSFRPSISADGMKVSFTSTSTNLSSATDAFIPGGFDFDIFLRDRQAGTTMLLSESVSGSAANYSRSSQITNIGDAVFFDSASTNLVTNDLNGYQEPEGETLEGWDIFKVVLSTGALSLVSLTDSEQRADRQNKNPRINPAGTVVVFDSSAPNIIGTSGFNNNGFATVMRDLSAGTTDKLFPFTSVIGMSSRSEVLLASDSAELAAGDTNDLSDVFALDLDFSTPITSYDDNARFFASYPSAGEVNFASLTPGATSCSGDDGLDDPLVTQGVSITDPGCMTADTDAEMGDRVLRLNAGATISFTQTPKPTAVMVMMIQPADPDTNPTALIATDASTPDAGSLTGITTWGPAAAENSYTFLAFESSAGITSISVDEDQPDPVDVVAVFANPASTVSPPASPFTTTTSESGFLAANPGARMIDFRAIPLRSTSCPLSSEPILANPFISQRAVFSSENCLETAPWDRSATETQLSLNAIDSIQLPPGTGAVLLDHSTRLPSVAVVRALGFDGRAITKRVIAPASTHTFIGFTNSNGIDTIRVLSGQFPTIRVHVSSLVESLANETVTAGETVSTGSVATRQDPVETSVRSPVDGTISITESQPSGTSAAGFETLGQQIAISAPAGTASDPLRMVFRYDASLLAADQDHNSVSAFRNGVALEECPGSNVLLPPNTAYPAGRPCVTARELLGDGDVRLTMLTAQASTWYPGVPDTTPPMYKSVSYPAAPFQTAKSFSVAWSALDLQSKIKSYRVEYRKSAYNTSLPSTYSLWKSTTATSSSYAGAAGATYCFKMKAYDVASNPSAYSNARCTSIPIDDRSLTKSGTWTNGTSSAYYLSTYTETKTKGRALAFTGLKYKKRLAVVATVCSSCGSINVYWNGSLKKSISLKASSTKHKQIFLLNAFSSASSGTMKIVVTSATGKLVRIDGFGASSVS